MQGANSLCDQIILVKALHYLLVSAVDISPGSTVVCVLTLDSVLGYYM